MSDTSSVVSSLASVAELKPGDVVGDEYRIVKALGEGGMALVFQVENLTLGTMAAMKVPRVGLDQALVDRFVTEARAHMTLVGQTHVVAPMQVGKLRDDRPFLVMQLVRGEVLDKWLLDSSNRPTEPVQALAMVLRFGIQIGLGLDAAHRQKPSIIHRDLKPSNIFVDDEQTVTIAAKQVPLLRIGDFGLAWSPGQDTTPMGTPGYVSPEQSLGLEPIPQSDLYSLGAILYELIESRMPFAANDTVELLTMHRNDPVPPLRNRQACAVPELVELVNQLLAKQPDQRPWNAREVVSRLEGILSRLEGRNDGTNVNVNLAAFNGARSTDILPLPSPAPPKSGMPVSSAQLGVLPDAGRRRGLVAGLVLLAFAAIAGWVVTRPSEPAPVTPVPVEPPIAAVVPPLAPVVVAPVVDAGSAAALDDDPLTPVALTNPKLKPVVPTPSSCEPTARWKQMRQADLADIEEHANALEPVEVERAVRKLGDAVDKASTAQDCGRVTASIEALKKNSIRQ